MPTPAPYIPDGMTGVRARAAEEQFESISEKHEEMLLSSCLDYDDEQHVGTLGIRIHSYRLYCLSECLCKLQDGKMRSATPIWRTKGAHSP